MTYPTNLGRHGQLVPVRGFSRWRASHLPEHHSAWLSADGLPWTDAAYRDADDLRTLADRLDPPPETT